jgi:hypothetical protein
MTINVVRLISGEELVADVNRGAGPMVDYIPPANWVLSKPWQLHVQTDEKGNPHMGLSPMLPLAVKDELTIAHDKIMFMYEPVQGIIDNYKQASSPIAMPNTPGIILP